MAKESEGQLIDVRERMGALKAKIHEARPAIATRVRLAG